MSLFAAGGVAAPFCGQVRRTANGAANVRGAQELMASTPASIAKRKRLAALEEKQQKSAKERSEGAGQRKGQEPQGPSGGRKLLFGISFS